MTSETPHPERETGGLCERLEAAAVGSRELDADVWDALFDVQIKRERQLLPGYVYHEGDGEWSSIPRVTTSLDAALALAERVLPGWHWGVSKTGACLLDDKEETEVRVNIAHKAPALALCIAVLKATAALEAGRGGDFAKQNEPNTSEQST